DEALAGVVRARKELLARWQTLDRALVAASSRLASGEAQRLRDELAAVDREVAVQEAVIARHLPRWLEHFSPEVMSLGTAQALLAPEEALLSYIVDDGGSYLVALRRDRSAFVNLDIGRAELTTLVRRVREQLDPLSHSGPRAVRRPFPVDLSVRLYRALIAPVETLLVGASHLIVVPDDVLESLPFGLLASAPPAKPLRVPADHAQVAWLARQFALSSVPSEGSLRALRRGGRSAAGTRPFSGWGDPVLRARAPRAVTSLGGRGLTRFNAPRESAPVAREVQRLDALPESRDVLFAIADVLRATDDDLHLREDATESALKRAELAGYGVLAFATWGLNAESLDVIGEPALVFTPPDRAAGGEDGFLTASEIATLRLNADLVILPATRTAGTDGTASREGVSELSRGFLHAGARTLLAAHWPVTADSTLKLTTRMLREQALGAGKAEALRRAMLMLANGEDRHEYAHPVYWAALSVVGEGGYAAATPVTTAITTGRPDPGERSIHPVLPGTTAEPAPAVPADTPATESGGNVFEGAGRLLRGIFGGRK
ncbi:MAG: CHAT domain-containing protein, partial [Proteobacteria bacterium]|nr:CHAT domain-containing protein [Pseudomonadota bacterium]